MATKASAIAGQSVYIQGGRVDIDVDMTLKTAGGSCGVQDNKGNVVTHKDKDDIEVFIGYIVYIQLSTVTFTPK